MDNVKFADVMETIMQSATTYNVRHSITGDAFVACVAIAVDVASNSTPTKEPVAVEKKTVEAKIETKAVASKDLFGKK